jgi:hypothetical protein
LIGFTFLVGSALLAMSFVVPGLTDSPYTKNIATDGGAIQRELRAKGAPGVLINEINPVIGMWMNHIIS